MGFLGHLTLAIIGIGILIILILTFLPKLPQVWPHIKNAEETLQHPEQPESKLLKWDLILFVMSIILLLTLAIGFSLYTHLHRVRPYLNTFSFRTALTFYCSSLFLCVYLAYFPGVPL